MVGGSSLQEDRDLVLGWILAFSLGSVAAGGTGTLHAGSQCETPGPDTTAPAASGSACSEPRPGCRHLLASGPSLTCIVYHLLQFLTLLPSTIFSRGKKNTII